MVSYKWAYARIMSGTILGGVLGFYVMHRLEKSYKAIPNIIMNSFRRYLVVLLQFSDSLGALILQEKMKERLIEYEKEMKLRERQRQDRSELLPDS